MKAFHTESLTREQAELLSIYHLSPAAFEREVDRLLARWCGTAVRRMRILIHGADEESGLAEGMRTFDDLLSRAERYGLSACLQRELDYIRERWLFRMNQGRVPNRWAA